MSMKNKVVREALTFLLIAGANLLFWLSIAFVTDQGIMAREYLYAKEMNGFWITTLLVYLLRINMGGSNSPATS